MNHLPVRSSLITSIAHDGDTLEIVFNNGQRYQYKGVTTEDFAAFRDAKSVGRYFGENIRGRFAHERIEEEKETE